MVSVSCCSHHITPGGCIPTARMQHVLTSRHTVTVQSRLTDGGDIHVCGGVSEFPDERASEFPRVSGFRISRGKKEKMCTWCTFRGHPGQDGASSPRPLACGSRGPSPGVALRPSRRSWGYPCGPRPDQGGLETGVAAPPKGGRRSGRHCGMEEGHRADHHRCYKGRGVRDHRDGQRRPPARSLTARK